MTKHKNLTLDAAEYGPTKPALAPSHPFHQNSFGQNEIFATTIGGSNFYFITDL